MSKKEYKLEESVEQKALKWTRFFDEKKPIYALVVGPIFDVQRLLGRAPFYRDKTGYMRFKCCSAVNLYSVLVYILISTTALLSIMDIDRHERASFIERVNEILTISMIVPQLVTPILSWSQARRQQTYLDHWFAFQEKFETVTESIFPQPSDFRPPTWKLVTHYFGTGIVVVVILPYYLSKDLEWHHFPGFYAGIVGNLLHFWYWIITAQVIVVVAEKFHSRFHEEILKGNGYTRKIEEYRLLWIDLNHLIRECGSSNSFTVSFFILSNMFSLVIITYNTVFRLPKYLKSNNYISVVNSLAVTVFFWNFMIVYCDAGYRMTESSFKRIFDNLMLLQRDGTHGEELYLSMFLSTVRIYPAKAIISEYYVINRSFFGSISTYLVTLIIVLEQFNISRKAISAQSVQTTSTYSPVTSFS